jgi:hypothetical protein
MHCCSTIMYMMMATMSRLISRELSAWIQVC